MLVTREHGPSVTYMSLIVHLVVGEFDTVKADDLTHPRLSCARRVRVHVEPRGDAGVVRVPGHHPLRAVVHVPRRASQSTWVNCSFKVFRLFRTRQRTCSVWSPRAWRPWRCNTADTGLDCALWRAPMGTFFCRKQTHRVMDWEIHSNELKKLHFKVFYAVTISRMQRLNLENREPKKAMRTSSVESVLREWIWIFLTLQYLPTIHLRWSTAWLCGSCDKKM